MTPERIEFYRNPNYLTWIHAEASEIDSDGCSGVTGLGVECCKQHDLEFWYGKDAHDAYRKFKRGIEHYWAEAKEITFSGANAKMRRCHQARSCMGAWSPLALWRWGGVTVLPKARRAWNGHRERDAERRKA